MRHCAIDLILALLMHKCRSRRRAGRHRKRDDSDPGRACQSSQRAYLESLPNQTTGCVRARFRRSIARAGESLFDRRRMPLPQYRLLPFPQLSLLTIPAAITLPLPLGSLTGFGDIRFVDLAVLDAGHRLLFGVGPTFVFPTASDLTTGQGKWQAGPAAAAAFTPRNWLFGVLAQNPISFAGDATRAGSERLVSSTVHNLSARPWLVPQI